MTGRGAASKRSADVWWPPVVGFAVSLVCWLPATLTVFPPMAGYLYFPLAQEGAVPYRDFYMPVTPLTYFLAQLSAELGDVRLVYMLGSLVLPPILFVSVYSLTRPLASVRVASILACFGTVSLISLRIDTLGGWNPLALSLTTACIALVARSLSTAGRLTWLLALTGGMVGGLAVLAKQTAAVPLALAFLLLFALSLVPKNRSQSPRIVVALSGGVLGFGLLIGCFSLWLMAHGALGPFVEDMSAFGGKNPSGLGAVTKLLKSLKHYFLEPTTTAVLLVIVVWQLAVRYGIVRLSGSSLLGRISLVLLAGMSLQLMFVVSSPIITVGQTAGFLFTVAMLALSHVYDPFGSSRRIRAVTVVVLVVPLEFAIISALVGPASEIPAGGPWPLEELWVSIVITAATVFALWTRALPATSVAGAGDPNGPLGSADASGQAEGHPAWPVLALSAALTLGWWLIVAQSGAGVIPASALLPSSAPLIAGLAIALHGVGALMARAALLWGAGVTTGLFIVIAWASPYAWHGWTQPSVFGGYSVMSGGGALEGMVARESVVAFYERLAAAIDEASVVVGKEDQTLFEFGNFPIAYALSGLAAHRVTECPNHWPDLCPQDEYVRDLARFANDPSDVVVWPDISDEGLKDHADAFDFSVSTYQDWSSYRDEQVANGSWREVARIDNGAGTPNEYPVSVYAVNPASPPLVRLAHHVPATN